MDTYLRTLGPGEFWFKINIALNEMEHGGQTIAYRIRHVLSNKIYVGWMGDAYRGIRLMSSRLQAGNFPNPTLQALVQQDSACELEVVFLDRTVLEAQALDALRNTMDDWIVSAGSQNILNSAKLPPRRARADEIRRTRGSTGSPKNVSRLAAPKPKPPKPQSERKERHSNQPWKNMRVTAKLHTGPGVFKILHVPSGNWFVGASKNIHESIKVLSQRLRTKAALNPSLQELFDENPTLELTVQMQDDPDHSIADLTFLANRKAEEWVKELGDKAQLLAKAKVKGDCSLAPKLVKDPSEAVGIKRGATMYQVTTKAKDGQAEAPKDFLHNAWFSYQRPPTSMEA